jgi:dTDP-4-dehydrorhamnose 3,5-epimerase
MNIVKTSLSGLLIIEPKVFTDDRGYFFESYNKRTFNRNSLYPEFVQDNESKSKKGVLRGLHYQIGDFAQDKLVRVIHGAVLDVAVDIREGSPTYGQYESILLSGENQKMFYIPKGFAHGFVSLMDDTIFNYKCSNVYDKESEGSILWNDEILNIKWHVDMPLISDKDKEAPKFGEHVTYN